jgi:hypothetical protein
MYLCSASIHRQNPAVTDGAQERLPHPGVNMGMPGSLNVQRLQGSLPETPVGVFGHPVAASIAVLSEVAGLVGGGATWRG